MQREWQQLESDRDSWKTPAGDVYGYITAYSTDVQSAYNWQAARGQHRLSGTEADRVAAMARAEQVLALPIDEFNRQVIADLESDLQKLALDILALAPDASLPPGYKAGFAAGVEDTRKRIDALFTGETAP